MTFFAFCSKKKYKKRLQQDAYTIAYSFINFQCKIVSLDIVYDDKEKNSKLPFPNLSTNTIQLFTVYST